jgi:hypothetical protein
MARAFMSWLSLFNDRLFDALGRLATPEPRNLPASASINALKTFLNNSVRKWHKKG